MIKANLRQLCDEFQSSLDINEFRAVYEQRDRNPTLKIPLALDRYFLFSNAQEDRPIGILAKKFHLDELDRAKISVQEVEEAIQSLKTNTSRAGDRKKLEALERKRVKLLSRMKNNPERISPLDERIFPGTFAPVVLQKNTNRKISCMRYRIRMPNGDEIPSKYNVFNARIDSLLKAPSWRSLFGKNHAIFPFQKFFEWVERDQKKCEISFFPDQKQLMWAASLFSEPKDGSYSSFAMITDEPPPEIAEAGHDRCPVFLDQREFTKWLSPQSRTPQELGNILRNKEKAFYFNSLTA